MATKHDIDIITAVQNGTPFKFIAFAVPGECDICSTQGVLAPAIVDGKTLHGPWARMCRHCFATHGVGLGLGRGQILIQPKADAP